MDLDKADFAPTDGPLQKIIDTPLPAVRRLAIRHEDRKVWSAEIRSLFKSLGIKGVSVTTPNHSMASSIDIEIPDAIHPARDERNLDDWADHDATDCPVCLHRKHARDHLESIILAAFPDLDNRSEPQTDHFDFCFLIR